MGSRTAPTLTYNELVDTLVEFLEVALHYVLYVREIYPAGLFEARRKYNVPVRMSRHPVLNGYIRDILTAVKPDLQKGLVSKLYIVIHDPERRPIEKFTFQIRSLMDGFEDRARKSAQTSINTMDIEAYLRSFLMKIAVCDSMLNPNPTDCSFVLLVELQGDNPVPSTSATGTQWVVSEPGEVDLPSASLIPLKTMDAGILKMQLYVEEMDRKSAHNDQT